MAITLTAATVHKTLSRYILADGFDLVIDLEKSQGARLIDARYNREFTDMFSFFASNPLGLNHPGMTDREFVEKLGRVAVQKPSNSDVYSVQMAEFVETFGQVALPGFMKHLFFIEGGALGVENALKASFDWKVRKNFASGHTKELGTKVIHFREAFHGRTGYTLSLTNTDPVKIAYFPKFDWPRIDNPKITFPLQGDNLADVVAAEKRAEEQIEAAFHRYAEDIAAIIIEPIQGEGGDNHFRGEFLRRLRELAWEHDVMLIFDEVQTGIGITGKMWCFEHFDVEPDMLCFGKKTQVCGFACTGRIDEVKENVFELPGRINSTWGGNLVDMVRCTRYLQIIEQDRLIENAARVGRHLLDGLVAIQKQFDGLVVNARGRGLMCAIDLPDTKTRDKLFDKVYENRLLLLKTGQRGIRFRPALCVTEEDIDIALEKLEDSIKGL